MVLFILSFLLQYSTLVNSHNTDCWGNLWSGTFLWSLFMTHPRHTSIINPDMVNNSKVKKTKKQWYDNFRKLIISVEWRSQVAPAGTSWWLQPLHWVVIKSDGYWSTCSSSFDRTWATELEWGGGGTHLLASRAALTLSGCGSSGRLHAPFSALAGNLWPGRGSGVRRVQGKANRVLHTWDFQM